MARGMIRFYGRWAVSQPIGFTSQVLFRFNAEGFYDLDAAAVTPMVLSKLMRRFPYQNLDAAGKPAGERLLNGVPFSGETGGVKIIINEKAMRAGQENLKKEQPSDSPEAPQEVPAAPAVTGKKFTIEHLAAAVTRKDLVNLAREMGVKLERADKSEDIRNRINKALEE